MTEPAGILKMQNNDKLKAKIYDEIEKTEQKTTDLRERLAQLEILYETKSMRDLFNSYNDTNLTYVRALKDVLKWMDSKNYKD